MSATSIADALGGAELLQRDINSELDLALSAMAGLTAAAANRLLTSGLLSADELYALVIPRRTFDRRLEESQSLTVPESDRLLRITRVIVRAIASLGDREKAATWLRTPNRSLRGMTPMALLETDIGARVVERTLGRIEHGVYS